jgi:hypothetical protein
MYKHHIFNGKMFTPLTLFVDGVVGFWHDYTDPTTWFQDTAGTTPAAALGDPVGRVDDKSGNSITGLQSTSAARPTYGRMPLGGVRNQVPASEDITNAALTKTRVSASDADTMVEAASVGTHFLQVPCSDTVSGVAVTASVTLQKGVLATAPDIMQLSYNGSGFGSAQYANVNVLTGAVVIAAGGATCTSSVDPAGGFRFVYTFTATATATAAFLVLFCNNSGAATRAPSYLGLITSDCDVRRVQIERGASATAYQKVVQAYDVTESGVASVDCLWFDGVDDHLVLTAAGADLARNTGRFTVFGGANFALTTGLRTLFYASSGLLASAARIRLCANASTLDAGGRRLDADAFASVSVAQSSFQNLVASSIFNYTQSDLFLRRNGVVVASSTSFQTDGNTSDTASVAVNTGRIDTSYFTGFMSGVITVKSVTLSESQLLQTERYLGNQIGVTI